MLLFTGHSPGNSSTRAISAFPSHRIASDTWRRDKQLNPEKWNRRKAFPHLWFTDRKEAALEWSNCCLSPLLSRQDHSDMQFPKCNFKHFQILARRPWGCYEGEALSLLFLSILHEASAASLLLDCIRQSRKDLLINFSQNLPKHVTLFHQCPIKLFL